MPVHAFRVDGSISGFPSSDCYSITNASGTIWWIDSNGYTHTSANNLLYYPGGGYVGVVTPYTGAHATQGIRAIGGGSPSNIIELNPCQVAAGYNPLVAAGDMVITGVPSGGSGTGALTITCQHPGNTFGIRLNNSLNVINMVGSINIGGNSYTTSNLNLNGLPTSSSGLNPGDVYRNGGGSNVALYVV